MSTQDHVRTGRARTAAATFVSERDAGRCVEALLAVGFKRDQIRVLTHDDAGRLSAVEPESQILRGITLRDGGWLVGLDVTDALTSMARRVLLRAGGTLVR